MYNTNALNIEERVYVYKVKIYILCVLFMLIHYTVLFQ